MNNQDTVKLIEPQSESSAKKENGRPAWLVFLLAVIGLIYLLNPTGGLIEFIPDNIPLVGNLDEGVAAVLVWQGISRLRELKKKNPGFAKAD